MVTPAYVGARRPLRRGELVGLDALVAAVFVGAHPLGVVGTTDADGVPVWAWVLVLAGLGVPMAVRRLLPRRALLAVVVAAVPALALGVSLVALFAVAFVLYVVALAEPARRWVPTRAIGACSLLVLLLSPVVGLASRQPSTVSRAALAGAVAVGCAWTVGRAVRERRAFVAHAAEQLAERAVSEERLRIARELHDVVAHTMSLIAVKAGVANHVLGERPDEARDALRVIETSSRGALTEMRQLLGVLRSADGDTVPSVGQDDLAAAVEHAEAAGVRVRVEADHIDELPAGVRLSTYRIVQEALTNVVRHAAASRCTVRVSADGREVHVEVTDDGRGGSGGRGAGHGLVGVRERVALHGGTFAAGPRDAGGFCLSARLPYERTPA